MPSTVIRHFKYDSETCELCVIFTSGRRYIYAQVPPEVVTAWRDAPSRGTYFNAHIRDHFAYRELAADPQTQ
jgi:lysyl-tRNA synthetase class 2